MVHVFQCLVVSQSSECDTQINKPQPTFSERLHIHKYGRNLQWKTQIKHCIERNVERCGYANLQMQPLFEMSLSVPSQWKIPDLSEHCRAEDFCSNHVAFKEFSLRLLIHGVRLACERARLTCRDQYNSNDGIRYLEYIPWSSDWARCSVETKF